VGFKQNKACFAIFIVRIALKKIKLFYALAHNKKAALCAAALFVWGK
jgi:hypothetical protein